MPSATRPWPPTSKRQPLRGLIPDSAAQAAAADTRNIGQRRHDALVEAVRQMLTGGGLPSSGGVKPRIVVTFPATCLGNRTGAGRLADGTQISPTLARLLACDAEMVPVTVDIDGNPLDVGRTRRLFTGPVRTALEVRDRGCAWPGCGAAGLAEGDSERASQRGTSDPPRSGLVHPTHLDRHSTNATDQPHAPPTTARVRPCPERQRHLVLTSKLGCRG